MPGVEIRLQTVYTPPLLRWARPAVILFENCGTWGHHAIIEEEPFLAVGRQGWTRPRYFHLHGWDARLTFLGTG
jgi:hypothetical protein